MKTKYDEDGYGYSAEIAVCSECGHIEIIKFIEDDCLDVNNDPRFYEYERNRDFVSRRKL